MPDRSALFVDTSGWAHLVDPKESHHGAAVEYYRQARGERRPILTSNLVLAELTAVLAGPLRTPKATASAFIRDIRSSTYVTTLHIDERLEEEVWRFWFVHADKNWTYIDCASFVVMRNRDITEALTSDRHFEQAGFVALLR